MCIVVVFILPCHQATWRPCQPLIPIPRVIFQLPWQGNLSWRVSTRWGEDYGSSQKRVPLHFNGKDSEGRHDWHNRRSLLSCCVDFVDVKRDRIYVVSIYILYIYIYCRASHTGDAIRVLYSSVSVGVVHVLCACPQVQSTVWCSCHTAACNHLTTHLFVAFLCLLFFLFLLLLLLEFLLLFFFFLFFFLLLFVVVVVCYLLLLWLWLWLLFVVCCLLFVVLATQLNRWFLAFFDTLDAKNTVNTFVFCASEAQNRGIYSVFVPVPSKNTGIYAVFTMLQDAKRTNTLYFTMFLLPERSRKIVKKRLKNGPKSIPTSIL